MKLFDFFTRGKPEKRSITEASPDVLTQNPFTTTASPMTLPAVYRCVDVIASSVAQLPVGICQRDNKGRESYIDNAITMLVNNDPSRLLTRYQLIYQLVTSMLLRGAGFALIIRNPNLSLKEIKFIHPDDVTIYQDGDYEPLYYSIRGNMYESDEVIHLLNYTSDGVRGISTLTHAANTLALSSYSETHAKDFFKGGGNLSGFLKVEGAMSEKQKDDLKKAWRASLDPVTGVSNGIAVLPGNIDFKSITVSPAEAQMIETRKFNVIDICRFFGVSPIKAFDLSAANYSTVEATQLAFLTDTLQPLLAKIEQEFTRKVLLRSERVSMRMVFDTDLLLRADKKTQSEYATKLVNFGLMSINEARQMFDLAPIPDGEIPLVPVNLQSLKFAIDEKFRKTTNSGAGSKEPDGGAAKE